MIDCSAYTLEPLHADGELVLYRGRRAIAATDGRAQILVLAPARDHASPLTQARLEHEASLAAELDPRWAVRPLQLGRRHGRTVLVLEDPGGDSLLQVLGEPMEIGVFLRLAIGLARAVGGAHAAGLIHKDIKPAHVLVNTTTGDAWLTGFRIASRSHRERQALEPPETIAGTLAYMAPEQTGRMNRSTDSRSDLYALGVTLYQLLTGSLPFAAVDPMGWVHCHIARQPTPPSERVANVPAPVSAVIMKLLAKTAEERYQTAAALERDLRRCLAQWVAEKRIGDFTLGERDTPDRLLIPERLYGRAREIQNLLAAFERVVNGGAPELALVSGYSGIGKSSVVKELHKVLVPPRGLFASGKFDQNKRDIPYATLAQAFQHLVGMILVEPEGELARYREAILAAVGPYGQFVVNLIPELERVIGKQPPIAELASQDAQRVFEQVLRRFIGVFARPEHPLALFLDDLQWLDTATLDVLQHLLLQDEVKSLLLVGAYRDNEVGPEHPLLRRLQAIREAGVQVSEIRLAPLALCDVRELIADALHDDDVLALAELVHDKTAGNPFFATHFITALADDGLIAFDPGGRRWIWDAARIAARGFTDNVVALMIEKITRLPAPCRETLRAMACIGNTARAEALAAALDVSVPDVHAVAHHAVDAGLVALQGGVYTFLHDRIQEASYALIAQAERPSVHLRVGRRLLGRTAPDKLDEHVFEIVNQLNRGADLVSDRAELDRIAELNAKAGQRAKAATAHGTALAFLRTGAAVLGDSGWQRRRALAFTLAFERAECEFLMGDLKQAEARLSALVARAEGPRERAAVACLRIMLYVTQGEPARSVEVCLQYLENEGIHFTPHPSREDVERELERMWRALGARSIEDLARLPETADPATLATLDVLAAVASPAWFTDQLLPALIGARIANISIERGNGPASSFGYSMLGMKLGPFSGDYRTAYGFGKLALELAERAGNPRTLARVLFGYAGFTRPWADDLSGCRELLERGFEAAERGGDVTYATYLLYHVEELMLIAGTPLEETEAACRRALSYARKLNFDFAVLQIQPQLELTRMLRGDSVRFGSFDSPEFDHGEFERTCRGVPALTSPLCRYWFRRQQAHFLAGDARESVAAAEAAEPLLWCADVFPQFAEYHFYGALARAECLDSADDAARSNLRERLEAHVTKLAQFGENSPVTFGSRAALAAAEFARIEGRERDAMTLYEQAIRSARAAGFAHIEALSFELAARFYAARGLETIATSHRREARAAFTVWGAHGKVRELEDRFPELRDRAPLSSTSTIAAPVEQLDLATVIRVSQAVSGEIVLEKLLDTLLRTAIEHAGAERALLIISRESEHRIAAEATTSGDTVIVRLRDELASASALPEAVLRYVVHTGESVILDDAATREPFSRDEYIVRRRARSVLGLPLMKQGALVAVLYLENNLAPSVFTPPRIAVLKLLASEAAMALENSRLYGELQEREARIRRLVDANIVGITIWHLDGRLIDVNDAFLHIVGYRREELTSGAMPWPDLTPPEWRAVDEQRLAEMRATGRSTPVEKEFVRKDGRRVPVLVGSATFEGQPDAGVSFVLDLTGRKQAEEALQRARGELAHVTRVTTLGELAASIAHEVSQPLAAIVADASASLNWLGGAHPDVGQAREALEAIVTHGHRAADVVRQIREMATKHTPRKGRLEINDVVHDVVPLVRAELLKQKVSLQLELAANIPAVEGDRVQLQQVLINLVINAIEAMAPLTDRANEIVIRSTIGERGHITVAVQDTGPGVDPTTAEGIFGAFVTTKPGGMGLGLSISRSIIESHGGRLWVSPGDPHGAVFQFSLPVDHRASVGEDAGEH